MLNIIRADLFRIFRSKGIYITLGVLLILIFMQVSKNFEAIIGIYVDPTTLTTNAAIATDPSVPFSTNEAPLTGFDAARRALFAMKDMVLFYLPLVIFVCATDFSSNTIKIMVASGRSRARHYFAKLILSILLCIMFDAIFIVAVSAVFTIINGFGASTVAQWSLFIRSLLAQMLLISGIASLGVFLVFATQKTAFVSGIYMAWYFLPTLVFSIILGNKRMISRFDVNYVSTKLAYVDAFQAKEVLAALLYGAVLLIVGTAVGLIIFKKTDIR